MQKNNQQLREKNSELDKTRNAMISQTDELRMMQISYEKLRDMKDIAQKTLTSYEEQNSMAKEELSQMGIQLSELRIELDSVKKSDEINTTSTENTASNDVAQEIKTPCFFDT